MKTASLDSAELGSLENLLSSYIAEKTSVALSALIGEPVGHVVTKTRTGLGEIQDVRDHTKDLALCCVFLHGGGDIRLGILYSIPERDAKMIAAKLLCLESVETLDDLGKSAVSEVGNIMSGSFFNALSDHTGLKVDLSTPGFAMAPFSSLFDPIVSKFVPAQGDIMTEVEFSCKDSGIRVHMLIIQDPENARKLLGRKG